MVGGLRAARREVVASRPVLAEPVTARIVAVERLSPSFRRLRLAGAGSAVYPDPRPADAFRLVLGPGAGELPPSRPLTVSAAGGDGLAFDVLDHDGGLLQPWLAAAAVGDEVTLIGVLTEFVALPGATRHLLIADAAGLPAVSAIVASLPPDVPATVLVTTPDPGDLVLLPARPGDDVRRVEGSLVDAVGALEPGAGVVQGFVAAEGAAVRTLRRDLVARGVVERDRLRASAYWWAGWTGDEYDEFGTAAWQHAEERGLDTDDPIVIDEVMAEGLRT